MSKYTEAQNMLVIRNENGYLIGAQIELPEEKDGVHIFISPAKSNHTLHRVSEVPAEICNESDPTKFHQLLNDHINSKQAKISVTSAHELNTAFYRKIVPNNS
jgi:hypothetical protein